MRKFVILLLCLFTLACSPEKGWTDPEPIHPDNPYTYDENQLDGRKYSAECQYQVRYSSLKTNEYTMKITISFSKWYSYVTLEFPNLDGNQYSSSSGYSLKNDVVSFSSVSLSNIWLWKYNFRFRVNKGYLLANGNVLDIELIRECDDLSTNTQTIRLSKK